jgi:hypothetical protein
MGKDDDGDCEHVFVLGALHLGDDRGLRGEYVCSRCGTFSLTRSARDEPDRPPLRG